jgi:hypothetical protein
VVLSWLVIDVGVRTSLLVTWASTAAQVEAMRKEHERAEWIQQQQQQLLEAKYRKHLARERPLNAMERELEKKQAEDPSLAVRPSFPGPRCRRRRSQRSRCLLRKSGEWCAGAADARGAQVYKPDLGFMIYFDFVTGLPTRVQRQVQVVYGFYQAENPRTAPKALPLTDVEPQGTESQRAVMALSRQFARVPANPAFKVVLEIQGVQPATKDRGPRTHPIAWTALALFSSETELNRGMWRVPLFTPPVRADVPPDQLHSLHAIAGSDLFLRLVMAQQADVHNKSLPPPSPHRLTANTRTQPSSLLSAPRRR